MKRQNWFPSRISMQGNWLVNYRDKINGYATTLGIAGGDIAATIADAKYLIYVLGAWLTEVRAFSRTATAALEILQTGESGGAYPVPVFTPPALPGTPAPATVAVAAGALNRIFAFVQMVKDTAGYDVSMGTDLQIEGAEDTADHPTPLLRLKLGQMPSCQCVDISITKYTHEGVVIESRRAGGAWEQVGVTTARTWTDERPLLVSGQPEVREFRSRYWDKGIANGPWSDVQKVTVAP